MLLRAVVAGAVATRSPPIFYVTNAIADLVSDLPLTGAAFEVLLMLLRTVVADAIATHSPPIFYVTSTRAIGLFHFTESAGLARRLLDV